ncbi:MAG TPA: hypothetical protein VL985_17860 [Stellaceae bacterium]|nr:hypothetical protein [Stellaceae bacterium]
MHQLGKSVRRGLLATVSAMALAAGAALWQRSRGNRGPQQQRLGRDGQTGSAETAGGIDTSTLTRQFLLYYIMPVWLAAGVADWVCHRATSIEATTGAKESLMHLLMLAEVSIPVTAGYFLEVTAPVAALMIIAFFLHEATALWDVNYAVTAREVTPIEQHVHSFLEMVPLMAISFIAVLHWPQFRALLGIGGERADLSLRAKDQPLPRHYIPISLGATGVFELLPYLEELYRCLRASHGRLIPAGSPANQPAG